VYHLSFPSPSSNVIVSRPDSFADFLREETTDGRFLLVATALALLWANVSESSYRAVWDADAPSR
jgi:Na+/H+ antiporter NhaA